MKNKPSLLKHVFPPIGFLLLLLSCQAVKAQTFQVNGRTIRVKDLNRQIEGILDSASLPGLSFAVIDHNKVVFYNAYGYKDFTKTAEGRPIGKDKVNKKTLFEACSLSKSFFVLAVYRLVDQGVLDLDVPLYQYLPYKRLEYDQRYKKITARMVLSHTSGLENWELNNDSSRLDILNDPGTKFFYSGEGYVYLSKVVEKLLNKTTEEYMKELVIEPLGLKRTFVTYSKDGRSPDNYSWGHTNFLDTVRKTKNEVPNIASYINTTAKNYAQLLVGIFNGEYLSKRRVYDIVGPDTAKHYQYPETVAYNHWGPGFAVSYENQDTVVYQAGNNDQWKGFGFYSVTRKIGYAMFVNGESGDKIIRILDSLTTGQHTLFVNGHKTFDDPGDTEYPDLAFGILHVYNTAGYPAALNYFKDIVSKQGASISNADFYDAGTLFMQKEPEFAAYITTEYKSRYPSSQDALVLHGKAMIKNEKFEEAITDFKKAIQLDNSLNDQLGWLITQCSDHIKKQ